jgi:hypothetical protein
MSNQDDWISRCVANARKAVPTATDATATRIKELLTELNEPLSKTDLTDIAKTLIADMVALSPEVEQKR